jgi:hypothetical protein
VPYYDKCVLEDLNAHIVEAQSRMKATLSELIQLKMNFLTSACPPQAEFLVCRCPGWDGCTACTGSGSQFSKVCVFWDTDKSSCAGNPPPPPPLFSP